MDSKLAAGTSAGGTVTARILDMKIEIVVLPVSDVDRAKAFYANLGWKLDMDFVRGDAFRVIQFTPPGSGASVIFGRGISTATPGSVRGLYFVVSDIEAVRADLLARGAPVGEIFHDADGVFHRPGTEGRVDGPAPGHRSYGSYAGFSDPDGNQWLMQEVTTRLPGHALGVGAAFTSASELAGAMRRAQAAYAAQEQRMGLQSEDPLLWYSDYILAEQSGKAMPA